MDLIAGFFAFFAIMMGIFTFYHLWATRGKKEK